MDELAAVHEACVTPSADSRRGRSRAREAPLLSMNSSRTAGCGQPAGRRRMGGRAMSCGRAVWSGERVTPAGISGLVVVLDHQSR